jgi:hypothetical protein
MAWKAEMTLVVELLGCCNEGEHFTIDHRIHIT